MVSTAGCYSLAHVLTPRRPRTSSSARRCSQSPHSCSSTTQPGPSSWYVRRLSRPPHHTSLTGSALCQRRVRAARLVPAARVGGARSRTAAAAGRCRCARVLCKGQRGRGEEKGKRGQDGVDERSRTESSSRYPDARAAVPWRCAAGAAQGWATNCGGEHRTSAEASANGGRLHYTVCSYLFYRVYASSTRLRKPGQPVEHTLEELWSRRRERLGCWPTQGRLDRGEERAASQL